MYRLIIIINVRYYSYNYNLQERSLVVSWLPGTPLPPGSQIQYDHSMIQQLGNPPGFQIQSIDTKIS